jgi:hypothetical protein
MMNEAAGWGLRRFLLYGDSNFLEWLLEYRRRGQFLRIDRIIYCFFGYTNPICMYNGLISAQEF